jgi:alkylation response protein AidB-like acyl-CoA dehydrogenase
MSTTDARPSTTDEFLDELRTWLQENWDPDLTVGEWWERLGGAGWSAPGLPTNAYGRGLSRNDSVRVQAEIGKFGALAAPGGLGLLLAAPTIATHGTQEQIDLYVREIVTGKKAWCQLFSEPGAGSDLAGLTSRAIRDGDEFIVNGQKVWTSGGQGADMGMLLARTDFDVPKHQGITWFAFDMHQPGVEVRPLREMTGRAMFNEVFMTDARVPADAVIGGLHNGWAAANTTLTNERSGLGAGGGSAAGSAAPPGTVANQLGRRVGDFVQGSGGNGRSRGAGGGGGPRMGLGGNVVQVAKDTGQSKDPIVRQDLVRLHTMNELARYNNLRLKAEKQAGRDIPGMPNIAKLAQSDILRLTRDLGLRLIGPAGMLHAYKNRDAAAIIDATQKPYGLGITGLALYAQGPPIYGGTDQIQRNILGERVLGLPKEPNEDRVKPFSELPRNA